MSSGDHVIAHLILPSGILEYFTIIKVVQSEESIHIYLEEQNIKPEEYSTVQLTSKGFFEEIKVQDFPIRGKEVFLFIKRRRWVAKDEKIIFRNWELVAQGTRMTKEFAAFLKVIHRYQAGKL
jgi:transposase